MSPSRTLLLTLLALGLWLGVAASAQASTVVWAVGDGGVPETTDDEVGAMLAGQELDYFLYLGDVYENGTASEFQNYYEPAFGSFKVKTRPTPGNHEWALRAEGYDAYWGPAYSAPHYYSFDIGGWHVISLNSEEAMGAGSAQLSWLEADLAKNPGTCTLAYWHRPRFAAPSKDHPETAPLWDAMVSRAAIVLSGHRHNYQRFHPIGSTTQFVVGTGGRTFHPLSGDDPRIAYRNDANYGALRLALDPGRADYSFVNSAGTTLDSGSVGCQPKPADADQDGITDGTDSCPAVAGPGPSGCPAVERALSIRRSARSGKFSGSLSSPEPGCRGGQEVSLFRVKRGRDARVGADKTNPAGRYAIGGVKPKGRIYATSQSALVPEVGNCLATRSAALNSKARR